MYAPIIVHNAHVLEFFLAIQLAVTYNRAFVAAPAVVPVDGKDGIVILRLSQCRFTLCEFVMAKSCS